MDFDLIFVYVCVCVCVYVCVIKVQLLHVEIQLSQHDLLRNLCFSQLNGHGTLQKISWPGMWGLISGLYSIPLVVCLSLCYPGVTL